MAERTKRTAAAPTDSGATPPVKTTRGRGRPSALTPEIQEKICGYVKAGNYFGVACRLAGISHKTGSEWMARGEGIDSERPQTPEFAEFAEAIKEAEAICEAWHVQQMRETGKNHWVFHLAFLSRKFPERWAETSALAKKLERMSLDELNALLRSHSEGNSS